MPAPTVYSRILDWLRAGYPEGIPPTDYIAVLGVLRRQLSDADIDEIADQLAAQARHDGQPVTAEDVHRMVRENVLQDASEDDVRRVSARLAGAGWPLSDKVD
jgi:Protein of unknown function (DUF3349)